MLKKLVSVREVSELLDIRESTVRAWLRQRRLPKVRVGGRAIRIPLESVEALVKLTPPLSSGGSGQHS